MKSYSQLAGSIISWVKRYRLLSNQTQHVYEVRPRKDHRGFDLISDAPPFGRLWYVDPNAISNAVGYAKSYCRSHGMILRVFDESGTVIETHKHVGFSGAVKRRFGFSLNKA